MKVYDHCWLWCGSGWSFGADGSMDVLQMGAMEEHVKKALYDEANTQTVKIMASLEQATGVKRENLTRCGYLLVGVYLVFGQRAALLCNAAGFLYPAYASIQAIESAGTADDTQWLMYWSVFGMFNLVDMASKDIMAWCPLYWLAKALLLLCLCNPITRGAEQIYSNIVRPLIIAVEEHADAAAVAEVNEQRDAVADRRANDAANPDTAAQRQRNIYLNMPQAPVPAT